jgi:hypothetical protein
VDFASQRYGKCFFHRQKAVADWQRTTPIGFILKEKMYLCPINHKQYDKH